MLIMASVIAQFHGFRIIRNVRYYPSLALRCGATVVKPHTIRVIRIFNVVGVLRYVKTA